MNDRHPRGCLIAAVIGIVLGILLLAALNKFVPQIVQMVLSL